MKKRLIKKLTRRVCKRFYKKDRSFNELMRKVTQNIMQIGSAEYKRIFSETVVAGTLFDEEDPEKVYLHKFINEEYDNMKRLEGRRAFSDPVEDAKEWMREWNS